MDKADSDTYLRGQLSYGWGDEVQVKASAHLKKPLRVGVPGEEGRDLPAFERKLREVGAIKPGERYSSGGALERGKPGYVSPEETTRRLQALGYDGIEVKAAKYTPETEGSQLVVFDAESVKYGHAPTGAEETSKRPRVVNIDVVSPGNALIVAGNHQARVGRDGGKYYVEDADTEEVIGRVASYKAAARLAAKHWGFADVPIELDKE